MNKVYLPFVAKNTTELPILSTYVEKITVDRVSYFIPGQHIAWGVKWSEVEKVAGEYDWSLYDAQYANIGDYPHRIQVKNTPLWARLEGYEAFACAPPKEECYEDFIMFIQGVIWRYKPYAVEIWNEPDVDPRTMPIEHTDYYGGWGGMSIEYAKFVKYIYNYLKPIWFPETVFVAGALMLLNEAQWGFARDLIEYGELDVLSFHSYSANNRLYDLPFEKADRLRTMTDKPLWLSETAYQAIEVYDTLEQEQAFYLKQLAEGAKAHDIDLATWYDHSWRNCNLVEGDHKKLVWYEFERLVKCM